MARLPVRLIAATTTLVIVGILLGSLGSSAIAAGHAVSIVDGAFRPGNTTIKLGDSVTWTNRGSTIHDVTFDTFGSPEMSPGRRYSHAFKRAGTFNYVCTIHGFGGTVVVKGPLATPKPTSAAATPTATAVPAAVTPGPSPVADVAASPTASPFSGGSAASPDSGGANASVPQVLLVLLVAAGVIGLGWRLTRRTS